MEPRSTLWVYGDDLSTAAAHQQDPVETLHHNLHELHVWDASVKDKHMFSMLMLLIMLLGRRLCIIREIYF